MQYSSVETEFFYTLPPFQSDKFNSKKGLSRKDRTNDSYTNMANTTSVFSSVRDVNAMPTDVDMIARSTARSSRKQKSFSSKRETKVTGN